MSYDQYGPSGQQNNPQGWGSEGEQNPWSNPQEQGSAQHYSDPGSGYPESQPSAGYPGSQPSASYPGSQQSASYPGSQQSASYPGSQPNAGYPGSQASAGYPGSQASAAFGHDPSQQQGQQQGGQPGQQSGWAAQPPANDPGSAWAGGSALPQQASGMGTGTQSKGLFATLFDFTFADYATPALAKILYILGIVIGILGWLGGPAQILFFGSMASAFNPYGGSAGAGTVLLALLGLIIGLVPLAFWIIGLRIGLEFVLATVRTQQDTAALRDKQDD